PGLAGGCRQLPVQRLPAQRRCLRRRALHRAEARPGQEAMMKTLALTAALVALVGCASTQSIKDTREGAQGEADQATAYLQEMRSGESAAKSASAVTVIRDGHYMPLRTIEVDQQGSDPLQCSIEYNPVSPATLPEIGQAISEN